MHTTEYLRSISEKLDQKCSKDEKKCSRASALGGTCDVYCYPSAKWRNGDCPMADNHLRETTAPPKTKGRVRVGQQKQKKRR